MTKAAAATNRGAALRWSVVSPPAQEQDARQKTALTLNPGHPQLRRGLQRGLDDPVAGLEEGADLFRLYRLVQPKTTTQEDVTRNIFIRGCTTRRTGGGGGLDSCQPEKSIFCALKKKMDEGRGDASHFVGAQGAGVLLTYACHRAGMKPAFTFFEYINRFTPERCMSQRVCASQNSIDCANWLVHEVYSVFQ